MTKTTSPGLTRALLLLVSLALAAAAACARPLVDPRPVFAAETAAQTRAAILRALIENHYTIETDQPGEIFARYTQPDWNMVVSIAYSNEVSVRYVSSENLDYETSEGGPVIHRGYNKRVQRLSNQISREIAILRATNALPAVAAPPPGESRPH